MEWSDAPLEFWPCFGSGQLRVFKMNIAPYFISAAGWFVCNSIKIVKKGSDHLTNEKYGRPTKQIMFPIGTLN